MFSSSSKYNCNQEKLEALRHLMGYDAKAARELTTKQVKKTTKRWAQRTGVIGSYQGLYQNSLGMSVCRSNTTIDALAKVWQVIATLSKQNEQRLNPRSGDGDSVYLITFPDCKDLYTYQNLCVLAKAIEMTKNDDCRLLPFTLGLFHPNYKGSPRMFSPERHSPFPSIGIEFLEPSKEPPMNKAFEENLKAGNFGIEQVPDDKFAPVYNEERQQLESLFNSAAAPDVDGQQQQQQEEEEEREVVVTEEEAIQATNRWMVENREVIFSMVESEDNEALRFMDSIGDRWNVSRAARVEDIYAGIWAAAKELQEEAQQQQQQQQQHSISRMFVSTKFCAFNAPKWRQVAIVVNAALKRLSKGKMFVEMFHPEYVFGEEQYNQFRRSPFAMIQICYVRGLTKER